jgi:hypothetical protein
MSESIKKSIDKLTQSIKSTNSQKLQTPILSSFKSKPKTQLETLINTPINSIVSTKSSEKPFLSQKASAIASKTIETTSSIFSLRNILFVILLIFLLSFLGFNIFTYLSDGTNIITNLFGPIFSTTGEVIGDATKNVVSTTSTGTQQILQTGSDTTKNVVDVAATGTTSGIGFLQDRLKKTGSVVNPENNNILTDSVNINRKIDKNDSEPEPVRTQALEQGYCFIGKINDTRYCAKVTERQQCMSGDIYPTMDICVNPNLRA